MTILNYFIFFSIGVFQDIFITYYYQTIVKEYAYKAAFFSASVTLINLVVLYQILTGIESQAFSIILVYAIGNGFGTFLVIRKERIKKFFFK
jgi:hypothetical protein